MDMSGMEDMDHGGHHDPPTTGGDHQHGDHENAGCPMIMFFHWGHCETILWKHWTARTSTEFAFSALAMFAFAFVYEGLKYFREKYYFSVAQAEAAQLVAAAKLNGEQGNGSCCPHVGIINEKKSIRKKIFNRAHAAQTGLHLMQVVLSYLLMLVVMTYNYWLCLAVILGATCGYFSFGWIRQQAIDFNEHCH